MVALILAQLFDRQRRRHQPGPRAYARLWALVRHPAGRADQVVYRLTAQTSLVGKAQSSLVRLRGWFKPQMALAISRNRQGYVATWLGGVVLVDSKPMNGRHELKDGDLLEVCGLLLEFSLEK